MIYLDIVRTLTRTLRTFGLIKNCYRERPSAIGFKIKSIDDTSNFDEFPDVDLKIPVTSNAVTGQPYKDWAFLNYTYKRFEGMSERVNRKSSKKSLFDVMESNVEGDYLSIKND